ncbi:unnamed protein product [Symbiodinium pilosum]|uniref:RNA-editing substrate-binding complex 6 protein domain-containing protein n=1 Tax=Symbiodinium pilosum TaxID=2952 RepID=A0A812KL32_SYMPI|nr:unnamed protein product [Symbiodinium pilosum]
MAHAAATSGASPALWSAVAYRCQELGSRVNYWDAVHILQAFTAAGVTNADLLMHLAEVLTDKTSKMAPKHILDVLAVYEAADLRPAGLYVELLHAIVRLARSMYAEELTLVLQALARYGLGNPTVVAQLMRVVQIEIKEFRLRYLCATAGALGTMRACPAELMATLDSHARFEVDTINTQELLDNVQAFPQLEYSWQPYEDLCLREFLSRVARLQTAEDVDQMVDPFQVLFFLQARGHLHTDYLRALTQWCLRGVHRPNVRSERRPTTAQLITLYDYCREHELEDEPALNDAIAYFVESGGGKWQEVYARPLSYTKKRYYIRTEDPLQDVDLPPLPRSRSAPAKVKMLEDLPGLPGLPALTPTEREDQEDDLALIEEADVVRKKPSGSSPLLKEGESIARVRVRSRRKLDRPRRAFDPLRKRYRDQELPQPLWYYGGWGMRPKYQPGRSLGSRYPYAKVPIGPRGGAWVLRR